MLIAYLDIYHDFAYDMNRTARFGSEKSVMDAADAIAPFASKGRLSDKMRSSVDIANADNRSTYIWRDLDACDDIVRLFLNNAIKSVLSKSKYSYFLSSASNTIATAVLSRFKRSFRAALILSGSDSYGRDAISGSSASSFLEFSHQSIQGPSQCSRQGPERTPLPSLQYVKLPDISENGFCAFPDFHLGTGSSRRKMDIVVLVQLVCIHSIYCLCVSLVGWGNCVCASGWTSPSCKCVVTWIHMGS